MTSPPTDANAGSRSTVAAGIPGCLPAGFAVEIERRWRYEVRFQRGLLARYGMELADAVGLRSIAVLTDEEVRRRYGDALLDSLRTAGYEPTLLVVPPGERSKSLETLGLLLDRLADCGFDRRGIIVNFGGGVICDLGGFLASTYMRGVDYVNFSTTLIGQLDASIGGKVAVNARVAKNLIGAFHHPRHVAGDPELLATLTARDFRSGMAEAIKVAIVNGPALFQRLERDGDQVRARAPDVLQEVVAEAASLKMLLINLDPYEADLRRPLNFGHTLGHPIETEFAYLGIKHGEAVAYGIGVATAIARRQGRVDAATAERIFALLQAYDLLGFEQPIPGDKVVARVRFVRMIRGNHLYFVLPRAVGEVEITDALSDRDLVAGFADYEAEVRARRR